MLNFSIEKPNNKEGEEPMLGEFILTPKPGHEPTQDQATYMGAICRAMERARYDSKDDPGGDDAASTALAQARKNRRLKMFEELEKEAKDFVAEKITAEIAADKVFMSRGSYLADLDRLSDSLFVVEPKLDDEDKKLYADITIDINESVKDDPADQAKQELYVSLNNAITVVKTVAQRIEDRASRLWMTKIMREREKRLAQNIRNEYLRKLVVIGRLGLQGPHVEHGKLALSAFRAEFVAQEAGRIKNTYLRHLGVASGIFSALFFTAYIMAYYCSNQNGFWYTHKIVLLAAGSAAIGTWLSFSIRRVILGFDDLAILEEDRLDPSLRVIFVIFLTIVVCLLFWTGAMNIEIGNLRTGDLSNPNSTLPTGAIALLVGVFCGISERALTTAVSGRAAAFVKTLGT